MNNDSLTDEQKKNIETGKKLLKGCGIGCGVVLLLVLALLIVGVIGSSLAPVTETPQKPIVKTEASKVDKAEYDKKSTAIEADLKSVFERLNVSQYAYIYYIDDIKWYTLSYKDKKALIEICANYGKFKTYNPSGDLKELLYITEVKSANNRKTLGKYTLSGYEFK